MTEPFSVTYSVKWADLDPVGHVRHSVYGEYAVDARYKLLEEHGYLPQRFLELGYAPVVLRQESRFYREVTLGDSLTLTIELAGLSPDGSRWKVRHDVRRSDGQRAARLVVEGTWMDFKTRQAVAPPQELLAINDDLPRTQNFEQLRSLVGRTSAR